MSTNPLPPAVNAVLWGSTFFIGGAIAGSLVDRVMSRILASEQNPMIRAAAQFGAGYLVLGEAMRVLIPQDTVAPIGDGTLLCWFFLMQRNLVRDVTLVLGELLDSRLPYVVNAAEMEHQKADEVSVHAVVPVVRV